MKRPSTPRSRALHQALAYPYSRPAASFIFRPGDEDVEVVDDDERLDRMCARRIPVLALGSNAAPLQLARKFSDGDPVVVVSTTLLHHDVVFAARVASYGALPATFVRSHGTYCSVHTTFLTSAQLEVMHRTESVGYAYDVVSLKSAAVLNVNIAATTPPLAYRARAGALCVEGAPRSLAAIAARERRFAAWSEEDALVWLAERFDRSLHDFVGTMIDDSRLRTEVNTWLRTQACNGEQFQDQDG